jgi:hypothetical protein
LELEGTPRIAPTRASKATRKAADEEAGLQVSLLVLIEPGQPNRTLVCKRQQGRGISDHF